MADGVKPCGTPSEKSRLPAVPSVPDVGSPIPASNTITPPAICLDEVDAAQDAAVASGLAELQSERSKLSPLPQPQSSGPGGGRQQVQAPASDNESVHEAMVRLALGLGMPRQSVPRLGSNDTEEQTRNIVCRFLNTVVQTQAQMTQVAAAVLVRSLGVRIPGIVYNGPVGREIPTLPPQATPGDVERFYTLALRRLQAGGGRAQASERNQKTNEPVDARASHFLYRLAAQMQTRVPKQGVPTKKARPVGCATQPS
jgi:hypothetical protein